MTSCFHIIESMGQKQRQRACVVQFARWQQPSDVRQRFLLVQIARAAAPGAMSAVSDCILFFFIIFTSFPVRARSTAISVFVRLFVSLSVRSDISETTRPNFTKFSVHFTFGRGSAFSDDNAIHYASLLPILTMTSCFHTMGLTGQNQARRYVSSGTKSDVYDCNDCVCVPCSWFSWLANRQLISTCSYFPSRRIAHVLKSVSCPNLAHSPETATNNDLSNPTRWQTDTQTHRDKYIISFEEAAIKCWHNKRAGELCKPPFLVTMKTLLSSRW